MDYIYIQNQEKLTQIIPTLSKADYLYIDLEFDKNHFRYGFNLCLMQLSDGENCYLIDPIDGVDVTSLFPILENPAIQKVSFAFGEDLRLLHHLGCFAKNILDLATVRILLNEEHVSLNKLISEITGEELPKSQQKSNWCLRPLSDQQLVYAALDVLYLPELKNTLIKRVIQEEKMAWVEQEIEALNQQNWGDENAYIAIPEKEKRDYTKREWMRYIALINFREEIAAKRNRPSYKIIDKSILTAIAKNPEKLAEWTSLKRIHPSLRKSEIKERLSKVIDGVNDKIEAEKIDKEAPARTTISHDEKIRLREKRNLVEKIKNDFYLPVKNSLSEKYGSNFANFVLSNRKIENIIKNEIELLPYQQELIENIAKELKLNIPKTSL